MFLLTPSFIMNHLRRLFSPAPDSIHTKDISLCVSVVRTLSQMSRSTRLRVGCVLWDNYERNIVSVGYNGTPAGEDNVMEENNVTLDTVIHAEMNALNKISWLRSRNLVCFVSHSPCLKCAKELKRRGVHRVYYLENYRDASGVNYLRDSGVPVTRLVMS